MLLTIDIGNSNVVLALYDEAGQRRFDARMETFKSQDRIAYEAWMKEHILVHQLNFDHFIISSVVPMIDALFFDLMHTLSNKPGIPIDVSMFPNLNVDLDNPKELGADLIATYYGAILRYAPPIIIADCGSANKITVIDERGNFRGGLIMPGIKVSQDALNQFIPHLPNIPLSVPPSVIGHDTISAMQAGLMYSNISALEGISERIERELGQSCTKLLTGGLSVPLAPALPDFVHEPFLLNEGLYDIFHAFKKP